jgi:phosphoribosylaminoimidazolecarboxamide formyltransferase/IMP cyclohydrolase
MRALLSVYDKSGVVELARELRSMGWDLISSGGTAGALREAGLAVTDVADLTGFPAILSHRVVTLHPKVHGGILADRHNHDHQREMAEYGIEPIDLVVTNLYPFGSDLSDFEHGASRAEELIDIGGPAMIRAAAKNFKDVGVVTHPSQYQTVIDELKAGGVLSDGTKRSLARAAFAHTAAYDASVVRWFDDVAGDALPQTLHLALERVQDLRYGENPHQTGARYREIGSTSWWDRVEQHGGMALSYLNLFDADAAWGLANDLTQATGRPAVAIIKHANPCGIAVGADVAEAHRRAHECDPVSAFGGVIAVNRPVSVEMARQVAEVFTEVVVAPGYDDGAVEVLQGKKNVRLLVAERAQRGGIEMRPISGGLLVQERDAVDAEGDDPATWTLATGEAASADVLADLAFAWKACRAAKSNAILLARDGASVGIGMGQVNRVDSCRLAVDRAGDRASGSVAASDAFFPFEDGPQILIDAGVRAIVQPGGSVRDELTVEAAKAAGVTMYLTGTRHFAH